MKTYHIPKPSPLDRVLNTTTTGDSPAMAKLRAIRSELTTRLPVHGMAAGRYKLVEDASVEVMAVDGLDLRFNPETVTVMSSPALALLLVNAIPQTDLELTSAALGIAI